MLELIETIDGDGAFWRQYRHPTLGLIGTQVRLGREGRADVITLVRTNIDFARATCAGEKGSEPFPLKPGRRQRGRKPAGDKWAKGR